MAEQRGERGPLSGGVNGLVKAIGPFVLPIHSAHRLLEELRQSAATFGCPLCEMPDADTVGMLCERSHRDSRASSLNSVTKRRYTEAF